MPKRLSKWQPSENQLAALKYAQERGYSFCVLELVKSLGISQQAYYQWRDDLNFAMWWRQHSERYFIGQLDDLYAGQLEIAKSGAINTSRTAAAKLLLERFDQSYAKQPLLSIQGPVSITFKAVGPGPGPPVIDVSGAEPVALDAGEDEDEETKPMLVAIEPDNEQ